MRGGSLTARVERLERDRAEVRIAVVELRVGENEVDAVKRHHLAQPEDIGARLNVFIRLF